MKFCKSQNQGARQRTRTRTRPRPVEKSKPSKATQPPSLSPAQLITSQPASPSSYYPFPTVQRLRRIRGFPVRWLIVRASGTAGVGEEKGARAGGGVRVVVYRKPKARRVVRLLLHSHLHSHPHKTQSRVPAHARHEPKSQQPTPTPSHYS